MYKLMLNFFYTASKFRNAVTFVIISQNT